MTDPNDRWIQVAVRVDAFRIIPRFLIIAYYLFFFQFTYYLTDWFMAYDFAKVENQAVALAVAGFPVGILGVMTGVLSSLTNNYFRTGRSWGGEDNNKPEAQR